MKQKRKDIALEAPRPSAGSGRTERQQRKRGPLASAGRGAEKRKSRYAAELAHAGTAKTTARRRTAASQRGESSKKIFLVVLIILLLGAIIAALIYFWQMLFGPNECTTVDLPPEYKAIICNRIKLGKKCEFNVAQCEVACPVGYKIDEVGCIVSCDCATSGLFESDVSFNEETLQTLLAAYMTVEDHSFQLFSGSATKTLPIWLEDKVATMLRIPYVLSDDLDPAVVSAIEAATYALRNHTCLDLVVRTDEPSYIKFVSGLGCSSAVGKVGGEQHIVLSKECSGTGSVLHEIMHALGFWHEHSRPDRDEHIRVMWKNIDKSLQHNFNTRSLDTIYDFGSPYDTNSLMQGGGYAHSRDLFNPSMIDLKTEEPVKIQRDQLSDEDKVEINSLYECYKGSFDSVPGAHWGEWSAQGLCSVTCGSGFTYNVRECLDKDREIIYRPLCGSDYFKKEPCDAARCTPGLWGPWSPCDHTCGPGKRTRLSCCGVNSTIESEPCDMKTCTDAAEAFWADWQEWGECLRTCGNGMRRRYRTCFDLFETSVENLRCPQTGTAHLEIDICGSAECPLDAPPRIGYWGEWGDWDGCTTTCGPGSHKRQRDCYSPEAVLVDYCEGDDYEVKSCNNTACAEPALSIWTPWGPWSECSQTCDGGTRTKTRKCVSSVPLTLETDCGESADLLDEDSRMETCNNQACNPKVTEWSEWGSWGECNSECGGTHWRMRTCSGGDFGDPECPWDGIYESEKCNVRECAKGRMAGDAGDVDLTGSSWRSWYQWTECTKTCGGGMRERYRLCQTADEVLSYDCHIKNSITKSHMSETESCGTVDCPPIASVWGAWSIQIECTATCGNGIQTLTRKCLSHVKCEGPHLGSKPCSRPKCEDAEQKKKERKGIFSSEKLSRFFGSGRFATTTPAPTKDESWRWHKDGDDDDKWNFRGATTSGTSATRRVITTATAKKKGSAAAKPTTKAAAGRRRTIATTARPNTSPQSSAYGTFWARRRSFCGNSRYLIGDFNGDGREDILCLGISGKIKLSYASRDGSYHGIDWEGDTGFCTNLSGMVLAVDFNGDEVDDLMCYKRTEGTYEVIFSHHGRFDGKGGSTVGKTPSDFCTARGDVLYAKDMNSDGRGDLVCQHASGKRQIELNEG